MAWPEGRVFAVKLSDDHYAYGRCLVDPVTQFYDYKGPGKDVDLEDLAEKTVAFTIWVAHKAIRSWDNLGEVALTKAEKESVHHFFKQDSISKKIVRYHTDTDGKQHEEPISASDVGDLEAAAVWSAVHVESRLEDHFAGRANKVYESLRPKTGLR
jgi:hypothetical protein